MLKLNKRQKLYSDIYEVFEQSNKIQKHIHYSIPSTDVYEKSRTVKYSLPCLMLLYSGELQLELQLKQTVHSRHELLTCIIF